MMTICRAAIGKVGNERRQAGCGVRNLDLVNGGTATGTTTQGFAEDQMQLRRQEVHRLVQHGIGQDVVAVAQSRYVAKISLGYVRNGFEDPNEDTVRQLSQQVA